MSTPMGHAPLTEPQAAMMQALWKLGSATAAEVHAELRKEGRECAITTVSTTLQRLEKQGWVEHSQTGRQFVYHPCIDQQEAARSALRRVIDSFFGGNALPAAAQLLGADNVSPEDLKELRKLLRKGRN